MPDLLGSGFGRLSGSAVLLSDLLEDAGKAGDGREHRAEHLGLQDRQCGDRGERIDGGHIDDLAIHEAALDLKLAVELLGIIGDHAGGSDGVARDVESRGAVELLIELIETDVVESKAKERILDDGIIDFVLAALGAKSSVLRDGDALVVDDDTGGRALQLLGQRGHDRLLFRQDFCVRHSCFHLR